jgi:preprotein translocase subunit SecA
LTLLSRLQERVDIIRGIHPVETDLSPYRTILEQINGLDGQFSAIPDGDFSAAATILKNRALEGENLDSILAETFALSRAAADRFLGMRPFDVQVLAGIALHRGKLVEMATGEGKTRAAVLPAVLQALTGRGVHILTFNDYLARRDARWMAPVYEALGLSVGFVQEGMSTGDRRTAYTCDVTYGTAKEVGFDFLRTHLCRSLHDVVLRPFHAAIIDEADSILIDESRTPLVIAGDRGASDVSPYRIAEIVAALEPEAHWETDENRRNVYLTDVGLTRVETALGSVNLHEDEHYTLLTEVNQALHARALLQRDVDYIVRDGQIELVDEFTGRVVDDRRWPDGLQAALEAKEGLELRPGGHILGQITMQHFLRHYPRLAGMTATAKSAAEEFVEFYGTKVVLIPPNRPCIRRDHPDDIYTDGDAKDQAIVAEIRNAHRKGRPVLVGTRSIEESERLTLMLSKAGLTGRVLNAKNDEAEAEIIAEAGASGTITISTNMAGRGTDIKLGGVDEREREHVVRAGGLYVIGTNRHESRRIDDQLRGRAGRQGDPGSSRLILSLEDDIMVRFGINELIPEKVRPDRQKAPLRNRVVRKEVDRLQRIVEGQNRDIRTTLNKFSTFVEEQRKRVQDWRMQLLSGLIEPDLCVARSPERHAALMADFGAPIVSKAERVITLHHIDEAWAEHLEHIAKVREGIHLVGLGGLKPLDEFRKQVGEAFRELLESIDDRIVETFESVYIDETGIDANRAGLEGPSSTWTYLVSDQVVSDLQQLLFGAGSYATGAGAALMTGPLLLWWGIRERMKR